jgi:putative flavoprotein involved in K+ transport
LSHLVVIPHNILGKSLFWWLDKLRLSKASVDSKVGKYLQRTEPVIGLELKELIEIGKVQVKQRTVSFYEREVMFMDNTKIMVDNIIWATGFKFDFSWIKIPNVLDEHGKPVHRRGISPVEGIYFLGLPWLSRVGSAQLNGIGYDAKQLYKHIVQYS